MGEVGVNSNDSPSAHIKENGDMNGINNGNNEDDVDEVAVVSKKLQDEITDGLSHDESPKIVNDDNNADELMETDEDRLNGRKDEGNISLPDTTDDENSKPLEPMEVDDESAVPSQNGHHQSEDDDDDSSESDPDKPVSINSDSEEECKKPGNSLDITPATTNDLSNTSKKANGNKNDDDVQEILSDKEDDCVVVEDDDDEVVPNPKETSKKEEVISPRRSARARKSVVSVRDFSSFDDDDDIEEIVDDPLSVSSKKRPGLQISPAIRGQTTITPTKALAHNNNHSSSATSGNTNNNKEPTLVIIDTNTLINNARSNNTTINLTTSPPKSNPNPFSALPVGISASSMFNQQPKSSPKPGPPPLQPVHQTLLPALTDDMFVLEAPSFIVPYIYEKPPEENLKDIVSVLEKQVTEMKAKIEKELQERRDRGELEEEKEEDETSQTSSSADKKDGESKPETPPVVEEKSRSDKRKRKKRTGDDDYDWDEYNTSTDEEASDGEERTKVLIKEVKEDIDTIKEHIITPETAKLAAQTTVDPLKKSESYFENPLGKFFMNIGINLVQEFVQTDLLRQQKRKKDREGAHTASVQVAINSLKKNLEVSKENNKPFKFEIKRCEYCPFKTESALAMAHHYETPHLRNYVYKCNFCDYETRPPHEILYHMEAVHNVKGKLDKNQSYHQCPNCPFEDNGKSKLARHQVSCAKKFKPEVNLCPPLDWEPPAKIPRIKPKHGLVGTATAYQAMAAQQQRNVFNQTKSSPNSPLSIAAVQAAALRARGRPQTVTQTGLGGTILRGQGAPNAATAAALAAAGGMMLPKNYQQLAASAMAAVQGNKFLQVGSSGRSMLANTNTSVTIQNSSGLKTNKPAQQPSISITPLPRQSAQSSSSGLSVASALSKIQGQGTTVKPGQNPNATGKTSFVVCEICDGYIKDLDQLRNHMQWIHKVKIHPKMIYNRPPLNCQKCQYRFFTDQGLERHLLGSHGLVTSSMQEAANKGKDAGRCPVCGRVYQWKLLNHVSRDHNMTLKPAHLSYKCTVCTATFGMYKQFESHVYSAHSTVAKKALDNKNKQASGSNKTGDSLLKPLKINDEITIIPQPASKTKTIEIE